MRTKSVYWLFPILLSAVVSLNFFWSQPLVPGFDTPYYLTEIRNFSHGLPNPVSYIYRDRYLTMAFPGMLSMVFGFDPVSSYRIAITIVYAAISLMLYFLFRNITGENLPSAVLSSALVVSPLLINYATMLFANFTGFLILFAFFAVETGPIIKHKFPALAVIFALILLIHNFSAVSVGLIVAAYYSLKILFLQKVKITPVRGIILIAVILAVLSIGFFEASHMMQPVVLGDEKFRVWSSFTDGMGKYWLYFFPIFMFVSLISTYREILFQKNNFLVPLAILLPSLLLSYQPYYHLNFLPERFASLICLSTYLFYSSVISLPKFKKYINLLAIVPLLLANTSSMGLIMNKGYRNFTSVEVNTYQVIPSLMDSRGIVLVPSDHYYWSRYFLDKYQIYSGDHFISCGTVTESGYFGNANFIIAKLLAEKNTETALSYVRQLKSLYPPVPVYILSDLGLDCGNGRILQQINTVRQLYHDGNWYLYEII